MCSSALFVPLLLCCVCMCGINTCSAIHWCWNQYTALVFSGMMLFWYADPVTLIKASEEECVGPRRWSSTSLSLHEFLGVAKALGHTLNTLAVACLAGGVRRYLLRHGQTPAKRIRMCGMVDTRSMPGLLPGSMHGASNNFSFIGVPLYTGDISPLERVARVGLAMSWVRHSLVVPIAIRMPDVIQVTTTFTYLYVCVIQQLWLQIGVCRMPFCSARSRASLYVLERSSCQRVPPLLVLSSSRHDIIAQRGVLRQNSPPACAPAQHLILLPPPCPALQQQQQQPRQTIFRRPESSSKAILRALPHKTTVGFSNMKGPAGTWSLAGYRVSNIHNGVQPMAFGSFISLFSYCDSVTFTHSCFETKTKQPEVCGCVVCVCVVGCGHDMSQRHVQTLQGRRHVYTTKICLTKFCTSGLQCVQQLRTGCAQQ